MNTKTIKKQFTIKELSDFYGMSRNTPTAHLKELEKLEKEGFIPLLGKHNVIKALATYYALNKCCEVEDGSDFNSSLDTMLSQIRFLEENIFILKNKEMIKEDLYTDAKIQIKKCIEELKNTLESLK